MSLLQQTALLLLLVILLSIVSGEDPPTKPPCVNDVDCPSEHVCINKVCEKAVPIGQVCTYHAECQGKDANSFCNHDKNENKCHCKKTYEFIDSAQICQVRGFCD